MNRRNLIKLGIISATASLIHLRSSTAQVNFKSKNIIKPNKVKSGDTVGIIAPATSVTSPDDILKVKELLDYLQLKPKFAKHLLNEEGYKTKSIKSRLSDFNEMFEDDEVKAIICIRGGYGSMGILQHIDYKIIERNPKIFIGYSDITAIHLAIQSKTSLVTLHGPMLLSDYSADTVEYYKKALFTNEPIGKISNPVNEVIRDSNPVRMIIGGQASGQLTGGNLSLICALMGTEYEIDTNEKILFLEDIGEEPYRIDRMLTQLRIAGKFKNVKGIVFGKCLDCTQKSLPAVWDSSLGEVLDTQLGDLKIPVSYGLLIGHTSIQYPIPYSLNAKLDANEGTLEILDSFCN
jgi:muramoyltetrapeptide carboxypeptidase